MMSVRSIEYGLILDEGKVWVSGISSTRNYVSVQNDSGSYPTASALMTGCPKMAEVRRSVARQKSIESTFESRPC